MSAVVLYDCVLFLVYDVSCLCDGLCATFLWYLNNLYSMCVEFVSCIFCLASVLCLLFSVLSVWAPCFMVICADGSVCYVYNLACVK